VDVLHAATQQLLERALCETSLLEEQIASVEHALEASTNVESDLMRGMMQLFAEVRNPFLLPTIPDSLV